MIPRTISVTATRANGSGGSHSGICSSVTGTSTDDPICFWDNPVPMNKNYKLDAKGGANPTNTVTIPALAHQSVQWSGSIAGRTECTEDSCWTGLCINANSENKADEGCP